MERKGWWAPRNRPLASELLLRVPAHACLGCTLDLLPKLAWTGDSHRVNLGWALTSRGLPGSNQSLAPKTSDFSQGTQAVAMPFSSLL
jgi:hypothetical protein